ncbi:MAG: SRPBCC family protein [Bdellovibrionota bacterium]
MLLQTMQFERHVSLLVGMRIEVSKRMDNEGLLQRSWSPSFRAATGALGLWIGYQAWKSKGPMRLLLLGPSVALLARSLTNVELAGIVAAVVNPVVRLRRTIDISAPVEEVYDFLKHFENYSRFMSYVQEVSVNERGGLHWKILGPARVPLQWDASIGAMLPGQKIAWASVPGSVIANEGTFLLRPTPTDSTRLEVELRYAPPAGTLGYAVGQFLGFDPGQKIDEDLKRLKFLVENSLELHVSQA